MKLERTSKVSWRLFAVVLAVVQSWFPDCAVVRSAFSEKVVGIMSEMVQGNDVTTDH